MKFISISLALLSLFNVTVQSQSIDSIFVVAAITKLQHSKEYTLKTAELMPEEKYAFKPTTDEMSFGEQLLHLSSNMGWLCSSYLSKDVNPVSKTDAKLQKKEEIIRVLIKTYDYAIDLLQHFDAGHLADTVAFPKGPMNKMQIFTLLNDHQTHHRAQTLVYLRLNGIKPPDYIGW